jgi:diguanylate cyclase (GGDEF)-like protein
VRPPEGNPIGVEHLARLEQAREEIAKTWLVRLIEQSSLDEIEELPTDRIARELPELIGDVIRSAQDSELEASVLSAGRRERAQRLAELTGSGKEASAARVARDSSTLHGLLLRELCREAPGRDREGLADAAERLALAVGAVQAAAMEELVARRSRELESQANTDTLTGLYNLRYLQQAMGQLVGYHERYQYPFGLLLLDVDGLKRINDSHGHAVGDRVLVQVAMAVRRSVRTVDTPARLGGDEFIVLAPHQSAGHATILAERLADAIERDAAPAEVPPVGVSIGVVSCPEHGSDAEPLMELADRAMYRAKASGERVAVAELEEAETGGGGAAPRQTSSR